MYLYSFTQYAGFDKVFLVHHWNLNFQPWALLQKGSDFFLVLWEEVSFPEIYTTLYRWGLDFTLAYQKFLSFPSLQLLHRMVYERYTTYKSVMKLFLSQEPEKLLLKAMKPTKNKKKADFHLGKIRIQNEGEGQVLVVFPDLWSYMNLINQEEVWGIFLSSIATQSKKDTHRWNIKSWRENLIFATGSEIFQEFSQLKKIYLVEPQKRYYASQQDPRYKVEKVVEKVSEYTGAELLLIDSEKLGTSEARKKS